VAPEHSKHLYSSSASSSPSSADPILSAKSAHDKDSQSSSATDLLTEKLLEVCSSPSASVAVVKALLDGTKNIRRQYCNYLFDLFILIS
jgi:hypothetical protein